MAKFVDAVLFIPTAGGTTNFTVSAAVNGYMTPAQANATSGAVYRYRAENATLTEWEIGYGVYSAGVLARTVVVYNSLGTTAKINFSSVPNVGMGMPFATDIFPTASDTPPTDPADNALWWESDTGILYLYYNDGTSKQWVGISTNANLAAVLFTSQSLTATQKAQARANIDTLKNNYIVNGAMMISQENGTTVGVTGNGYVAADMFTLFQSNGGANTIAQVASATAGGSPNRLRFTVTSADAAVAAGDYCYIDQRIEGFRVADLLYGASNAKTVTLQFGVKAPAGTYCIAFANGAGNRSYVAEYVISGGEANTDVVKSVIIAGDQTGTWAKDTTIGLTVRWGLMVGSTFQQVAGSWGTGNVIGSANQFNVMGTNGNVFELFDVSLTEGSAAPAFQLPDFPFELLTCRRYWQKSYDYATAPGAVATPGAYAYYIDNLGVAFHSASMQVAFGVSMRSTPTVTSYSTVTGASGKIRDANSSADTNANVTNAGNTGFSNLATSTTSTAALNFLFQYTANARL